MKNNIILIVGKKQSGKDTIADCLKLEGYCKISFADDLKYFSTIMLQYFFGISVELTDWEREEFKNTIIPFKNNANDLTYRQWLQKLGTEFFRNHVDRNFWINRVCDKIDTLGVFNIVIPDVRFENEYTVIRDRFEKKYNISVIKVERSTNHEDDHSSETSMDNFQFEYDFVIQNDFNTKIELYDYLHEILF